MPVFVDDMLQWAFFSGRHFLVMLWFMWVLAVVTTVVSESFLFDRVRRRVLAAGDDSWRTILTAAILGILSPPSRSRIFRQARVYKDRNRDTAWYAIIDEEWPGLRNAFSRWLDPTNFDQHGRQRLRLSNLTKPILKRIGNL